MFTVILCIIFLEITLDIANSPPLAVDIDAPTTPISIAAPIANGKISVDSKGKAMFGSISIGRQKNATIPNMLVGITVNIVSAPPINAPLRAVFGWGTNNVYSNSLHHISGDYTGYC